MAGLHRSWSTDAFEVQQRHEAWDQALCSLYGRWTSARPACSGFSARVEYHTLQNFSVVECICDPCAATRGRIELQADDRDFIALQLVLAGAEQIRFDREQYELVPGDIFIWDSTRPMDFRVTARLHKISVLLPLSRFQAWLPQDWQDIDRLLRPRTGAAALLASYIESLSPRTRPDSLKHCDALVETTIGLLINSLDVDAPTAPESQRDMHLGSVRHYIAQHLTDADLSPARIALASRISVRYLHWLFEGTGSSVSQYIIRERLQRCRRDLENPAIPARKLIDVAVAAGFNDVTHFSRRFKQEFGLSPRDFRQQAAAARRDGPGVRHLPGQQPI